VDTEALLSAIIEARRAGVPEKDLASAIIAYKQVGGTGDTSAGEEEGAKAQAALLGPVAKSKAPLAFSVGESTLSFKEEQELEERALVESLGEFTPLTEAQVAALDALSRSRRPCGTLQTISFRPQSCFSTLRRPSPPPAPEEWDAVRGECAEIAECSNDALLAALIVLKREKVTLRDLP